jgi:predicted dehydrogenase
MSDIVRLGVVGAGAIAQRGILPHLSQHDVQDRVILQAVCDPIEGRAEAAAAKFGVRRAFTSYQDLLEHGDVDAVTIASPIGLHYAQGRQALEAGKHVHFNKTMTTMTAEATELIELARASGLKIVASPGEVLRPQIQHVKKLIAEGAIGQLCWAMCGSAFGRYHEEEHEFRGGTDVLSSVDPSWYFRQPGGGPLYDMTVYQLHMVTSVLGPVRRVTALSGTRIPMREFRGQLVPTDAHDNTLILLDFGTNVFALAYGTAAGSPCGWYPTYYGTAGVIEEWNLNGQPIPYPGREIADQAPGWTGEQWLLPHVVGPHRTIEEQHVFEDIMQLVDWVREDKPSPVTAERARHVIEIIEAAYTAAQTGQTQMLTTTI